MDRVLILGGGVGGTLTANLLARKLRRRIAVGAAEITVVDETGEHVYQPGFMYLAMGGERVERLRRPERSLLDSPVNLVVGKVARVLPDEHAVELADGRRLPYDHLVIATGARLAPVAITRWSYGSRRPSASSTKCLSARDRKSTRLNSSH